MANWPRDDQAELLRFYGMPGAAVEAQLVHVVPPFKMYYDGHPIPYISFHRKAASALQAALTEIWEHYGKSQAEIDKRGISKFAGSYNPRKVRGSATKWSNHAFGAALDLNASENGFNSEPTIPQPVIDAFRRQGARWGGDYKSRKDPMHFEFCHNDEAATFSRVTFADTDCDSGADAPPDQNDDQPAIKPFWKSRLDWMHSALAALGIGGAGTQLVDGDTANAFVSHVSHASPMLWFFLAVCVAAGVAIYLRQQDRKAAAK